MKKKIVAMLLCAAMVAGTLTGCGNGADAGKESSTATQAEPAADAGNGSADSGSEEEVEAPADNASSGEEVTIRVFSNLPDRTSGQGLIEQMLFDQYMAENPNVHLEIEALDDNSYKTKFNAYASGSSMPDFINVWGLPSFLSEVIDAGLIAELNPDDYKDYNFLPGSLDGFSKDGKLYGLARNTDVMLFYYNKALFEENGVKVPETYDDLLSAAKTFNDAGIIPVSMDGSDKYPMTIFLSSIFQRYIGDDTKSEMANAVQNGDFSNEAWSSSLALMRETVDEGLFQTGFETTDYGTAMNLFTNGQAAMYYMGSWEMSMATNQDIPDEIRNNIGVFTMPMVDGGNGKTTDIAAWHGGGHAVTANSPVKEEAIKLLNFMYEPENWSRLCWENGVCMSAQNFYDYLKGDETQLQLDLVDIVKSSTNMSGALINDLGTNEYKTIAEDATTEYAIGTIDEDEFKNRVGIGMK